MRREARAALTLCLAMVLVWALVGLMVNRMGLVINNSGSGSAVEEQPVPDGEITIGDSTILWALIAFIWLLIVLAIIYIIIAIITKNKKSLKKMVIVLVFFIVFISVIFYNMDAIRALMRKNIPGLVPPSGQHGTSERTTLVALSPAIGMAIILIWLAVAVVIIFYLRRGVRKEIKPLETGRKAAIKAIGRAIDELQSGGEFRFAILRCYLAFCELLRERGMGEQETMTPAEVEEAVRVRFFIPKQPLADLTLLFEEARYSVHDISPQKRDAAIEALNDIKTCLEQTITPSHITGERIPLDTKSGTGPGEDGATGATDASGT